MKALVYKNLSDAFDVVDVAAGNAICNIIKTDWEHSIAIVNGKTVFLSTKKPICKFPSYSHSMIAPVSAFSSARTFTARV